MTDGGTLNHHQISPFERIGEVLAWLNRQAWKACRGVSSLMGSNPHPLRQIILEILGIQRCSLIEDLIPAFFNSLLGGIHGDQRDLLRCRAGAGIFHWSSGGALSTQAPRLP